MKKVKKKYIGLVLKGGGVTITLTENLNQNQIRFIENRFGKEYFQAVKEVIIKEEIKNVDNSESAN